MSAHALARRLLLRTHCSVLQIAMCIIRGDIEMQVLSSVMAADWDIPPRIGREVFLLHLLEPAVQIIWLHHASGASPADQALMPDTQADADLLEVLEFGMTRVRQEACGNHEQEALLHDATILNNEASLSSGYPQT